MDYHTTITTLFALIAQANMADDSCEGQQPWQVWPDALESTQWGKGYFGHLHQALILIAGERIFRDWCKTGEIDFSLANRNPREDANKYADLDKVPFGC